MIRFDVFLRSWQWNEIGSAERYPSIEICDACGLQTETHPTPHKKKQKKKIAVYMAWIMVEAGESGSGVLIS